MTDNLNLDDESIQMLHDYEAYMGDDSFANHLAHKIWQLWKAQK